MAGKVEDIERLVRLQEVDNIIEDGAEAFNNSPIATEIGKVRLKKAEVKAKRDQVDKVFVKARDEVEVVVVVVGGRVVSSTGSTTMA